jgi:DNA-binding NarL/FixJ family response regulator
VNPDGDLAALRRKQARVIKADQAADAARADRDREICRAAKAGKSYRQIAKTLDLSLSAIGKIVTTQREDTTTP